ncbi:hypothetical protein TorRG33x02_123340 [Trema orientale]|uniref:Uncharacterized protein n=1 Tax=Trema orientale TaxID=63057 RepID=A0A2P5F2I7_TREOI|nr:hypothetical protein TorRG33x02_123340 [Trema orientale]
MLGILEEVEVSSSRMKVRVRIDVTVPLRRGIWVVLEGVEKETHKDRLTDTGKESSMPSTMVLKWNGALSDTTGPTPDILSVEKSKAQNTIVSGDSGWPLIPEASMTGVDINLMDNNNGIPTISKLDPDEVESKRSHVIEECSRYDYGDHHVHKTTTTKINGAINKEPSEKKIWSNSENGEMKGATMSASSALQDRRSQ